MGGAIAFLFKIVIELSREQSQTREEVGEFRGRHEGIKHLSAQVLQTVHDATTTAASQPREEPIPEARVEPSPDT